MPLYVFECPEHGRVERLRPVGTQLSGCDQCTILMPRVYGYSVAITQAEPDTRGMFRRFSEASAERDHQGVGGPSLWQAAKHRAEAISRAGEIPAATRRTW